LRISYPRSTFYLIYEALREKVKEKNPRVDILKDGKQDTGKLGVKWDGTPGQYNAASIILDYLVEDKFLDAGANLNFGKQLYIKRNQLEQNDTLEKVVIQGREYNDGIFRFLGYSSRVDFERDFNFWETAADKSSAQPEANRPLDSTIEYTYYIGTYYSYRSYRVNKFVMACRYDNELKVFPCWLWGFHTREKMAPSPKDRALAATRLPKSVASVSFEGTAEVHGRHLYVNLAAPAADGIPAMEMHLIGFCDETGGQNLADQDAIPCSLQTVSLDQYTVSAEAYLLRCSEEEAMRVKDDPKEYYNQNIVAESLRDDQKKSLQLYLMLQRRNFRVKFPPMTDLDQLEYRGNSLKKYTERLTGEYRIWNFGLQRSVVVQSKLLVSGDTPYQTFFYPYLGDDLKRNNPGLEEQPAVLGISNEIRQDQLCFSTFVKRHLTLVNYAIFDIRDLRDNNWVEGMFVTTGYDERGIVGGYAVMCKVKPGESCEPCRMTHEEALAYAKELGLEKMHTGLRTLWKNKLWKKKSNERFEVFGVITDPKMGVLMRRHTDGPYNTKLDLPGGALIYDESPVKGLQRLIEEQVGLSINGFSLWTNESDIVTWRKRSEGYEENLKLIGALYKSELQHYVGQKLKVKAIWVQPGEYTDDSFTPFALKAMKSFAQPNI